MVFNSIRFMMQILVIKTVASRAELSRRSLIESNNVYRGDKAKDFAESNSYSV